MTEVPTCSRCGEQVSAMSNSGDEIVRSYEGGVFVAVRATCASCREKIASYERRLHYALQAYGIDPSEENHRAYKSLKERQP